MNEVRYMEIDEVLAIHDLLLENFGGQPGIRDFALLHSAIERPKASFAGTDLYPTVFEKAAALVQSVIVNHPFNDANKRTGIAILSRFLYLNGYLLRLNIEETYTFALQIALKDLPFHKIASWIEARVTCM